MLKALKRTLKCKNKQELFNVKLAMLKASNNNFFNCKAKLEA